MVGYARGVQLVVLSRGAVCGVAENGQVLCAQRGSVKRSGAVWATYASSLAVVMKREAGRRRCRRNDNFRMFFDVPRRFASFARR
jgi:hypothetical protein